MAMTLEEVADLLKEAEVAFEASEDGELLRVLFETEKDEYVDLDGNPSIAFFLTEAREGKTLTIDSEAILDLSNSRFRGAFSQAVIDFMDRYAFVRTRLMEEPARLVLCIDFMLEDGVLTAEQLKSSIGYLLDCCMIAKPFLQKALETGKIDLALITPDEES